MNSQVVVTAFAARRDDDTLVLSRKQGFPEVCPAAGPGRPSQGYMCAGFWPFLGLTGATGFVAPAGPVIAVTAC
jgi:hypothetical protein